MVDFDTANAFWPQSARVPVPFLRHILTFLGSMPDSAPYRYQLSRVTVAARLDQSPPGGMYTFFWKPLPVIRAPGARL